MADRLLLDLDVEGLATVGFWPEGGPSRAVWRGRLEWPLDEAALEDLRWYLEDYLRAPFGVWEDRGPRVAARLAGWGEAVFTSVFGSEAARDAYQQARDRGLELLLRSASPGLLGLPWELMRDPAGPVALRLEGVSRALSVEDLAQTAAIPGGRLRVLMVISRPSGTGDIGYQMIARPLLERLDAVRGEVDLVVLRPPTLDELRDTLAKAAEAGAPFQVVHFDGHGVLPRPRPGATGTGGEGMLDFEKPGGGSDQVAASKVAAVLKDAGVPVVVLNACQSGAVGKDLEAAVATRLLQEGCSAVVAMAYNVYAVAAAEFMATFYERLFAGDTVSTAVTAGRGRLFEEDRRPSPKGDLPLADWLVPVHYMRRDVRFTDARTSRAQGEPSLKAQLDDLRTHAAGRAGATENLDAAGAFVGRDDLFFEMEAAARLQNVAVLYGPGGTGKTELAKAFGRWWRDTGGVDRPEWVLWHSFEPGIASFGLDGVITETGLAVFGPDFARLSPAERRQKVEGLLADQRLLLIWDNFEALHSMPDPAGATAPLDDAERAKMREFLVGISTSGRSAVVITSRTTEAWLGPVCRIKVGGLAPEEAAQYAGQLLEPFPAAAARRAQRAFGELLEWLDGHPLSMRLILPGLDASEPDMLLEGLRGTKLLPDGDEGMDRATSLAASITYSFTHLTAQTQRLLPAVSLFQGVADLDVLTGFSAVPGVPGRFAGADYQDWERALDDAARVGLLTELGAGMYQIHPALPAYLTAGWRAEDPGGHDSDRDAATWTLATAYAGFGSWLMQEINSGNAGLAYGLIDWQRRSLGTVLGYALERQMWEQTWGIVWPLNFYWDARGLDQEAAAWADRVRLAIEGSYGGPPSQGTRAAVLWLFVVGQQANRQVRAGRLDDAERTYRQILAMSEAQPTSPEQQLAIASGYQNLGVVTHQQGRLDEAGDLYHKALTIREDLPGKPNLVESYLQLGKLAQARGRLEDAEDWYRRALAISKDLGSRPAMAANYQQLGTVAHLRGQLADATNWFRHALTTLEGLGDRRGMAGIHHMLGIVAQERGHVEEAEYWYRESLVIQEEFGNRPGMTTTYHQLGTIAQDQGRLEEAEAWYSKALAIKEDLGDRPGMATDYHQLGIAAQTRGRLEEAEAWYRKSLAIREDIEDPPGLANTYHHLGMTAHLQGRLQEAETWYGRSLAIRKDLENRVGEAASYYHLGAVARDMGHPEEAQEWYHKSLAITEDLGDRPHIADSYYQIGLAVQDLGRLGEAEDWYRRSLAIREDLENAADRAARKDPKNRIGMAMCYQRLGAVAQGSGRPEQARDWLARSLAIFEDHGNRPLMVESYEQLGLVAYELDRLNEAEDWYLKSLTIREDLGDRPGVAISYENLGMIAEDRERTDEAENWYLKSLTIREDLGDRPGVAISYEHLGAVAMTRRRLDEAEDWYLKSLGTRQGLADKPGMARIYWRLGLVSDQRELPRQALEWMIRSVTVFAEFPHPLTDLGSNRLALLTAHLGIAALEASWLEVTGGQPPQTVRDYISSRPPGNGN